MRGAGTLVLAGLWLASCTPEVNLGADLSQANARAQFQTAPGAILVYPGDVDQPYDVLGDVEVIVRQRSAFGVEPNTGHALRGLRVQAGRLGAHAIIMVSFGQPGASLWSYHELRGHGRAIRFR